MTKKNKRGGITLPDGKACNLAAVAQRLWDFYRAIHIVGWVRMENPETGPHTDAQAGLAKMLRQFLGGRVIFSVRAARTNGQV